MENLIKNLTQKNENVAIKAATELLDSADLQAFKILSEKSDFLFDFIKTNVCKRLYNAADDNNYLNIIKFFDIYDDTYSDVFIKILCKYTNKELPLQMLELLKNGTNEQKAYCAKYFANNANSDALKLLKELAFSDYAPLATNATKALAQANDRTNIDIAYKKLDSKDDFEVLTGITFLTTYPELSQIDRIIEAAIHCSMPENAANEIANAIDIYELVAEKQTENNLSLFNAIINGFGEILPLYQIIDYKIFDITRALINQNYEEENSQVAQLLLNMYSKFKLLYENDEYTYDEDIETKSELKKLISIFQNQGDLFWNEQKEIIFSELSKSDIRAIAALQVIKELKLDNDIEKLLALQNNPNETIICMMVGVLANLKKLDLIDLDKLTNQMSNQNLVAIMQNYS